MSDKFTKTDKQRQAIDLLGSDKKYIALGGGSRSGKSFIIIYSLIIRCCKEKSRHAVLRNTFNAVKRSIVNDTFPKVLSLCFPDIKVKINRTDYIATFPNGSEIYFLGLDGGERSEKILGLELSTVFFNEASEIDYHSVQIALSRLAEKNNLNKKALFDFNPPTKSHWTYHLFIKHIDPIDSVPLLNDVEYGYMRINPSENLHNIDKDYLKLLESMPEKQRIRFLEGEFNDESEGQAYYSFRRDKHIKEIKKEYGTVWSGMDFNIMPMTAVIGQYIDEVFYIFDEVYLENADTYRMVEELSRRGHGGVRIIPDSTASNRKTSGKSDLQILKEAGFYVESTRNPYVVDRVNNTNRLFTANRILIDPKCKKLINDLERVSWKDNKLDQTGDNKLLTHVSDSLAYLCWKLDPFGMTKSHTRQEKSR